MRRVLIPTAAGLALIANAGLVSAQGPERGGDGHHGPAGGHGAMQAPEGGMRGPGAGPHHGEMGTPHASPAEPRIRTNEVDQRRGGNVPERRGIGEREQQRQQRATQHEPNRSSREGAVQDRRRPESGERNPPEGLNRHRQANENIERREPVGQRRAEMEHARTRLSMDDRARLHRTFDLQHARVTNPRFDWHVGHRIPRSVHLLPIPVEVVSFFPYYRDMSYFVVGDDVCIVDPRSYEVIDVIDQGYWGPRSRVVELRLSAGQIALVRDSIPGNFPEAGVRLRLALGAEIPDDVALYDFPGVVLDRIPELRDFQFLVTDDQIVIVVPHDRSIALVIDRA